jgi:hypothetical protein
MATIVTALIYSGVPNPTWELNPKQEARLKKLISEKKEVTFQMSALSLGNLGYKGFLIESTDKSFLPQKTFLFDGVIDMMDSSIPNFVDKNSKIESFLLDTAAISLAEEEKSYIKSEIEKNVEGGVASMNSKFEIMVAPPFNPAKWNNDPTIIRSNNCYNYSNDKITNTFAQPGRGSGQMFGALDCGNVSSAAQRDGQLTVPNFSSTPVDGHFIALVIWPGRDYHWYRLDNTGTWSHKPGQTPARNTDNSGRIISDPRNCDRGPYSVFCGFYNSIASRTKIL